MSLERILNGGELKLDTNSMVRTKNLLIHLLRPSMLMIMTTMSEILPVFNMMQTVMQKHTLVFTQIASLKNSLISKIDEVARNTCYRKCACRPKKCNLAEFSTNLAWARVRGSLSPSSREPVTRISLIFYPSECRGQDAAPGRAPGAER